MIHLKQYEKCYQMALKALIVEYEYEYFFFGYQKVALGNMVP